MTTESATPAESGRLLIEIIDIDGSLRPEVIEWVRTEVARRSSAPELGAVQAWLGQSDDTGTLGADRSRVILLHHPTGPTGGVDLTSQPQWLTQRHIYDGTAVSRRRAAGRPDPETAIGLRFVAMNCADGAEDEFHAWYEEDHLPKFTDVGGVLEGRRLHSPDSPRQHLALYWLEDIKIVGIPEWKAAAGTDWTAQMRKKTFDRDRINLVPFPIDQA
ncbi:MAG: hypothetical protein WBB07_20585 [Mycobacterium sp.]